MNPNDPEPPKSRYELWSEWALRQQTSTTLYGRTTSSTRRDTFVQTSTSSRVEHRPLPPMMNNRFKIFFDGITYRLYDAKYSGPLSPTPNMAPLAQGFLWWCRVVRWRHVRLEKEEARRLARRKEREIWPPNEIP